MARGLCPSRRLIHLSRSGLSSGSYTRRPSAWNLLSCPSQHNSSASPGLSGSVVLSTVFPEAPEQGRSPSVHACGMSLMNPLRDFFLLCKLWTPDASIRRITFLSFCHTFSICLFKGPLVPSHLVFCLHPLLPPLTASHRQQLQCIQNQSFHPTFQGLRNVYNVVLRPYILDFCQ